MFISFSNLFAKDGLGRSEEQLHSPFLCQQISIALYAVSFVWQILELLSFSNACLPACLLFSLVKGVFVCHWHQRGPQQPTTPSVS
jgi:hypothetical protein